MPETAIGLMAKYPSPGKVKTRLAKTIGESNALKIYLKLLQQTCNLITSLDAKKYLRSAFIAPSEDVNKFEKLYVCFDIYGRQQGSDLGERMSEALRTLLSHNDVTKAMLIGADCPELTGELIDKVPTLLEDNDVVLGPSQDGGYYLIGLKKVHAELFSGINWGTSTVLEETLHAIKTTGLTVAMIPELRDLDREDDMKYFINNGTLDTEKLSLEGSNMKTTPSQTTTEKQWRHHIDRDDWQFTPDRIARGYIQPHRLRELWVHTGTRCNLGCWFCLEGSGPKANRIEFITLDETRPYIDEAITLGVEQISFTGGEPFLNPAMVPILNYALDHRPCMVLTNGTKPLREKIDEIRELLDKPNALKFRISLDFPDPERHDDARGTGSFAAALRSLGELHKSGFAVSIARHREADENVAEVDAQFQPFLEKAGLPSNTTIISFPELHKPGNHVEVPHITENCMTTYKDENSRSEFMCAYSKMIVKTAGKIGVYACTLVDDDTDYDLGSSLTESMDVRVMLKHHRCYSCFAAGTSCSE